MVRDVVDLVLVQADRFDLVYLDLVSGGDAPDEVVTTCSDVLGHGKNRGGCYRPGWE